MKWVTSHAGVLHVRDGASERDGAAGVDAPASSPRLDARAVHELLFDAGLGHAPPAWLALLWARDAIAHAADAPLIWIDADGTFYPPAAAAAGVPLSRLCIVRPAASDVAWTAAECLRCRGVAGVVAQVPTRMSRLEARRLQLAVEAGGGVGVLMRPRGRGDDVYAAATRWLVAPAPTEERAAQRWRVELIHGHGRLIGQSFFVESHRARIDRLQDVPPVPADAGVRVREAAELADRPPRAATA